jgi:hypothetical protein
MRSAHWRRSDLVPPQAELRSLRGSPIKVRDLRLQGSQAWSGCSAPPGKRGSEISAGRAADYYVLGAGSVVTRGGRR